MPLLNLGRRRFALLVVCLLVSGCSRTEASSNPQPRASAAASTREPESASAFVMREAHPAEGALPAVLATDAAKAKERGFRAYAYVWATWCEPCTAIKRGLSDPRMVDALRGAHVTKLDMDEWGAALKAAGLSAAEIPVFFELDDSGKPSGRKITGGAWGENTVANMAPPLKAFFAGNAR